MDPGFFFLGTFAFAASIPIVAILTRHQRQMAELHQYSRKAVTVDQDAEKRLSSEISDLRQIVAQQAIIIDDLNSMHRRLLERSTADASIKERLSG